jgi:hypothetical protein
MIYVSRAFSIYWPVISKKKIKQRWQYRSGPLAAPTINIARPVLVEEIHRLEASNMEIM